MYCYLLQDWTYLNLDPPSGGGAPTLTQPRDGWLDLGPYGDLVFWLQVAHVDTGGGGNLQIFYETAPLAEDGLFKSVASAVTLSASTTPDVTVVRKNSSSVATPLASFVRWRLEHSVVGHTVSAEFRIYCATTAAHLIEGCCERCPERELGGREATHLGGAWAVSSRGLGERTNSGDATRGGCSS